MKVPTNFVSGESFLARERALYWCVCGYEAKFIHTGKFIGLKAYIRKEERSKISDQSPSQEVRKKGTKHV